LIGTKRSGAGQTHRIVLEDAARFAGDAVKHGLMGPGTSLGGATPTYGIYESADGYVALGALEPHFRQRVLDTLAVDDTHEALADIFATRESAHWEKVAAVADIPLLRIATQTTGDSE
jgi:alpha-methylacyl-CoA racemase